MHVHQPGVFGIGLILGDQRLLDLRGRRAPDTQDSHCNKNGVRRFHGHLSFRLIIRQEHELKSHSAFRGHLLSSGSRVARVENDCKDDIGV